MIDCSEILLVFALDVEAQGLFDNLSPLYCGVGKVNAAYRLTDKLASWKKRCGRLPELVLNLGSAGSTYFGCGEIINCTSFVQRDFDATALGCAPYSTPYEDIPIPLANGIRYPAYLEGICGTGDNFETGNDMSNWNVVDMEAYALAKICKLENISFGCLKYITDGADGAAAKSWQEGLTKAAVKLHKGLLSIL